LRASILLDQAGKRQNSKDNTPAVIHYEVVDGAAGLDITCAAKGLWIRK
jgi:fumarate hydratase, class I